MIYLRKLSSYCQPQIGFWVGSAINPEPLVQPVSAADDIYLRKAGKSTDCTVLLDEEPHRVTVRGTTNAVAKPVVQVLSGRHVIQSGSDPRLRGGMRENPDQTAAGLKRMDPETLAVWLFVDFVVPGFVS